MSFPGGYIHLPSIQADAIGYDDFLAALRADTDFVRGLDTAFIKCVDELLLAANCEKEDIDDVHYFLSGNDYGDTFARIAKGIPDGLAMVYFVARVFGRLPVPLADADDDLSESADDADDQNPSGAAADTLISSGAAADTLKSSSVADAKDAIARATAAVKAADKAVMDAGKTVVEEKSSLGSLNRSIKQARRVIEGNFVINRSRNEDGTPSWDNNEETYAMSAKDLATGPEQLKLANAKWIDAIKKEEEARAA